MSDSDLQLGDHVTTMNAAGSFSGVIVAFQRTAKKALVCENYFAYIMMHDFGATLDYVRDTFTCRSIALEKLMRDEDEERDDDE